MPSGAAVICYPGKRGVVWRVKFIDAAGRQVCETLGSERDGWTEKKAKAELRERLVRVGRKGYRKPAALTFTAYAESWFAEGARRRQWSRSSLTSYRCALRRIDPYLGHLRLAAIRPRHITAFVSEALSKWAPATVNLDIGVLHDIFATAKREELVDANPAENVEHPKVPRRRWRILEPVEVARVAKAFTDEQARTMFLVLALTGLRRHELRALRWRDVDHVEGVLRVRKSKTEAGERAIALPAQLAEALWQLRRRSPYQGDAELVFCEASGAAVSVERWKGLFAAALTAAGIEGYVRPFHDLPHTAITNDAAAGASALAVMTKAGHSNMATTRQYLHLAGVVFRDEADALERRLLGAGVSTGPSTDLSASEGT